MNVKADDLTQVITEAFSFDVVKLPLYAPDNQPTGIYGLFRDDLTGKDALVGSGSVTNRYVPHTNDDVVALVEAASNVFEGEVDVNADCMSIDDDNSHVFFSIRRCDAWKSL